MKFSEVVTKVINLSTRIRNYWSVELPKRHPHYPVVSPTEDSGPPPPEEAELRDFLKKLPSDDVYKLLLIMYLGRGDFEPKDLGGQCKVLKERFPNPDWAVSQMMGKAPLADYLTDGVAALKKDDVDIDEVTVTSADCGSQ